MSLAVPAGNVLRVSKDWKKLENSQILSRIPKADYAEPM